MKLSSIQSSVRVTFDYVYFDGDGNEQTSTEWVEVARLPFRKIAELQKQFETVNDDISALAALIAPLILDWSVTDDDGKTWAHDADALMEMPFDFVGVVAEAVVGKLTPGSRSVKTPPNSAVI